MRAGGSADIVLAQPTAQAVARDLDEAVTFFPGRGRLLDGTGEFVANAAGFFYLNRIPGVQADTAFLLSSGFAGRADDRLAQHSFEARARARLAAQRELDYLILVPTLRCNLACSYCQVSRAPETSSGFDWSEETAAAVERMLDGLPTKAIKLEFQGGEPTLRLDLVRRMIERCARFEERSFVICTNLSQLSAELLELLELPEVTISTSLDGAAAVHSAQRTGSESLTHEFLINLATVIERFGPGKVSALPTINQASPPEIDELIDTYARWGFHSIHLRPVNYQGFARKRHPEAAADHQSWWAYHEQFVRALIERNYLDRTRVLEESYFSLCLRRVFRPGLDRHVDLRNPNPLGIDYLVVDFDGQIYPTDESRMLARSGVVDLSIGNVATGVEQAKLNLLNAHSTSIGDPACDTCAYQPFCGRDLVDDLSRYGRIDVPRHDTFFCQKQLRMFDLAVELIYSDEPAVRYSLARWLGLSGGYLPPQAILA